MQHFEHIAPHFSFFSFSFFFKANKVMSVWGNRRWRWSPLALISSAADSVGCTPEGSGDESLITAGHCCCVCSWGQELLYYLLLSHWAFRWSWHHLTPHLPCSQTLLYKNTLNAHRWLYTHFHFFSTFVVFFLKFPLMMKLIAYLAVDSLYLYARSQSGIWVRDMLVQHDIMTALTF